jgi:hypothetical protein
MFLEKERLLYRTLNMLKKGDKLFLGYCWIPKCEQADVFKKIESIKEKNRNVEIPTF